MYKHILIPTDGSKRAEKSAGHAIRLAKKLGARVTALHVVPEADYPALEAWVRHDAHFASKLDDAFRHQATLFLENVRDAALLHGVQCECRIARSPLPHEAIVRTAHDIECDLIFMAPREAGDPAHAESQTAKVAAFGDVPVLVDH